MFPLGSTTGKTGTNLLQKVYVPIINNRVCYAWHELKDIILELHDEMFCAGHEQGKMDACLVSKNRLWHIVSFMTRNAIFLRESGALSDLNYYVNIGRKTVLELPCVWRNSILWMSQNSCLSKTYFILFKFCSVCFSSCVGRFWWTTGSEWRR